MSLTGITISKTLLTLSDDHIMELQASNIGIKETKTKYILYYKPQPYLNDNPKLQCHLKGLLTRIRSDQIYNAYNDDFGSHLIPKIHIRAVKKVKVPLHQS